MEAGGEKATVTQTDLKDEYYWKLVADLIGPQSGEGLELDKVPCTKRVLIQVGLIQEDNNIPWLIVTDWLKKLFPEHHSTDFRCLIEQGTATMQSLGANAQQNFLESYVNFNFIGPVCDSIGVERKDLLEMRDFSERAQSVEVTNGLILELNNFVAREKIAPIILVTWLRNFNPLFCKDGNVQKAYKTLRPKIKKLKQFIHYKTRSHRRSAAIDHLLQSPFELLQKKVDTRRLQMKRGMKRDYMSIHKVIIKEEQDEHEVIPWEDLNVSNEDPKADLNEGVNEAHKNTSTDGGKAATLMDIAMLAVQKLSKVYGEKTETCRQVSLDLLKNQYSLTCKEHKAIMEFQSTLDSVGSDTWLASPVTFLHVNANVIVNLHEAVDRQIMAFENEIMRSTGQKLGRDQLPEFQNFMNMKESATSRYIYMACDVLNPSPSSLVGYKRHWLAFCREKQNPSTLPTWNQPGRFNSFLKAAASLTHHHAEVAPFFSDMLAVNNEACNNIILQSITADASDAVIQSLVCVLAVLHLKVLGPYWQLLRSEEEYSLFSQHVLSLYQKILDWCKDPKMMLEPEENTDIFGQIPQQEKVFSGVFQYCSQWHTNRDLIGVCMKRVIKTVAEIIEEHLRDFLSGGSLSQVPPPALCESLSGCTFSILMAEYPFSLLYTKKTEPPLSVLDSSSESDSDCSREINNRSVECNDNDGHTTSWQTQEKGPATASKNKLQKRPCKIHVELEENMDRDYITATVQRNGGPCRTRTDVDKLLLRFDGRSRAEKREALRCEFLYQKLILNNTNRNLSRKFCRTMNVSQRLKLALPRIKPGYSLVWAMKKTNPRLVQGNVQENMQENVQNVQENVQNVQETATIQSRSSASRD